MVGEDKVEEVNDSKAPKSGRNGRKRRRARELTVPMRAQVRRALASTADLERVAEEYKVAKLEVVGDAVAYLLRKDAELHPPPTEPVRPFVLRKPVEREGYVERQLRRNPQCEFVAVPVKRGAA